MYMYNNWKVKETSPKQIEKEELLICGHYWSDASFHIRDLRKWISQASLLE